MPNDANTIIIMATEHGKPVHQHDEPILISPGINSTQILRAARWNITKAMSKRKTATSSLRDFGNSGFIRWLKATG